MDETAQVVFMLQRQLDQLTGLSTLADQSRYITWPLLSCTAVFAQVVLSIKEGQRLPGPTTLQRGWFTCRWTQEAHRTAESAVARLAFHHLGVVPACVGVAKVFKNPTAPHAFFWTLRF